MLIFDIATQAIDKGFKTLADIPEPKNSTVDKGEMDVWCNSTIGSPRRYNTLTKACLGLQSYANFEGNLTLLTSIGTDYVASVQDDVTTFSVSNNWNSTVPYYANKNEICKFFVSILPNALVEDTTFTKLNIDLTAIAPSTVNGTPQGGAERFNLDGYDAGIEATHPVLVIVPVVLKLYYDHKLPTTVSIDSFDVDAETFTKGGNTEGWIRAMKWTTEHNNGASLHHATVYCNNNDIVVDPITLPMLTDRCDFQHVSTQLAHDTTGAYDAVTTRIQDAIVLAAQKGGLKSPTTGGSPTSVASTTVTQTEQRTNEKSEQKMRKLRLLLIGKNDKGELVAPKLARHVLEAFKETTPVKAAVVLNQAFRDYRTNLVKKVLGSRGGSYSFSTEQLYPFLLKELMECNWFTENLTFNPSAVTREITLFAFLKANVNCTNFKEIVVSGRKIMSDAEMAPTSTNHNAGTSTLYTKGLSTKVTDGLSALANTEGILSFFLDDPIGHTPLISEYLARSYECLDNMETKATLEQICDGPSPNRYFMPNFLKDINQGISYFAAFSQSYAARAALEKNENLAAHAITTLSNVAHAEASLRTMMATGKFGDMNNKPPMYDFITSERSPPHTPQPDRGSGGNPPNGGDLKTPQAKKQKQQRTPANANGGVGGNNDRPNNSVRGVIKNAEGKSGLPKFPNGIKAKMPNRDNAFMQLCNKHIMDGVTCTNGNCRYAHVNKNNFFQRITNVAHQKMFCDYVNNDPNFTWAYGAITPQG